jgi:hypothetical protein
MRAYFNSDEVVTRLRDYNGTMAELFFVATDPVPLMSQKELRQTAQALGLTSSALKNDLALMSSGWLGSGEVASELGFSQITDGVLGKENQFIAAILSEHLTGYSTSTRDLFHDLIP